jgi:hypothetical protein
MTTETAEDKKKHEEKERRQQLFNTYRNVLARERIKEFVDNILLIELRSELPIEDFLRAILKLASNDTVLRAALEHNITTTGKPDLTKPEATIKAEI